MIAENKGKGKVFYESPEACKVQPINNYSGLVRSFTEFFDAVAMVAVVAATILIVGRIYLIAAQDPIDNLLSYIIYDLSEPLVGVLSQTFHFTNTTNLIQSAVISVLIYLVLIYGLNKGLRRIRKKYKTRCLTR